MVVRIFAKRTSQYWASVLGEMVTKWAPRLSLFRHYRRGCRGAAHVGPPSINLSVQHCGYLISLFTFTVYFLQERDISHSCVERYLF